MWPFDFLRRRKYERNYKAALAVFLGVYGVKSLSAEQQSRVEEQVDENFNKSVSGPKVAISRGDWLAAERAAAMQRLGIGTGVEGLTLNELFAPFQSVPMKFVAALGSALPHTMFSWDGRPSFLATDFRPTAQATQDARDFLRRNGIHVPQNESWTQ